MNTITMLSATVAICSILATIFAVYNYVRKPQIQAEKDDALLYQQMSQFRLELTNLKDNHLHTLEVKVDGIKDQVGDLKVSVEKLWTVVDERIPRKMV